MLCLEYYGNTKNEQEITVSAVIENQKIVTEFIDNYLEKIDCPLKIQMKIDIAIDELFSNIAFYAYDGKEGDITVKINKIPDCDSVEITFIDSGKAYNPLEKEDPDVTLSAEERKIGGLGIFIVKKNMDAISYNYINNQNVLTIRKNLF
ncbi:MAG: ATP-binding protein [Lachnospiraceae bacterium]|nr:ATP-binding protein [Lachnospiraceae bacterium]